MATREQSGEGVLELPLNVGVGLREDLLDSGVHVGHYPEQILTALLDVLDLVDQVRVPLLHRRELLQRQRIHPAQQSQPPFRLLEATLLRSAIEGRRGLVVMTGNGLIRTVFGNQILGGEPVFLKGLLGELVQSRAFARPQNLVAVHILRQPLHLHGTLAGHGPGLPVVRLQLGLGDLQFGQIRVGRCGVIIDHRGYPQSQHLESTQRGKGLFSLLTTAGRGNQRLLRLLDLGQQLRVTIAQAGQPLSCRASVEAGLVMCLPCALLFGMQLSQPAAVNLWRACGPQVGQPLLGRSQVRLVFREGPRHLSTLRRHLLEAAGGGGGALSNVHIAFCSSGSLCPLCGRLVTHLVPVRPCLCHILLDAVDVIVGPLPADFHRDQLCGRLFQSVAQGYDVGAFRALTRDPSAQHLPGHGRDEPVGVLGNDCLRLIQGLGDETVPQHQRQCASDGLVGVDETESVTFGQAGQDHPGRDDHPQRVLLTQAAKNVSGGHAMMQDPCPGIGPEQRGDCCLVPWADPDDAVQSAHLQIVGQNPVGGLGHGGAQRLTARGQRRPLLLLGGQLFTGHPHVLVRTGQQFVGRCGVDNIGAHFQRRQLGQGGRCLTCLDLDRGCPLRDLVRALLGVGQQTLTPGHCLLERGRLLTVLGEQTLGGPNGGLLCAYLRNHRFSCRPRLLEGGLGLRNDFLLLVSLGRHRVTLPLQILGIDTETELHLLAFQGAPTFLDDGHQTVGALPKPREVQRAGPDPL